MDVDEYEVSEDGADGWFGFRFQKLEELWHQFSNDLAAWRNVHRAADEDRTVSKTGQIGRLHNAGRDARPEQLPVPFVVVPAHNGAGVFSAQMDTRLCLTLWNACQ